MSPRVSVVIPCRNVGAVIGDQLRALSRQTLDEPFEVVLSDNGGEDDLHTLAATWRSEYPLDLRVVDSRDRPGVSHARNVGLREARGDLVAVCDADDVVSDDWLRELVTAAEQAPLVGGAVETVSLNSPEVRAWRPGPSLDRLPTKFNFLPYAMGCNVLVDRATALAVGSWDEDYVAGGDDIEFSWRMQLAGHRIAFAPGAVVHYRYRTDLRGAVRQAFAYGRTDPELARSHIKHGLPSATTRQRTVIDARWLAGQARLLLRGRGPRGLWMCRAAGFLGRLRGASSRARATSAVGEPTTHPVIVYVLRNYPQLSQTFVRNEIAGLRRSGVDVRVFSLYEPGAGQIPEGWAGPYERVRAVSLGRSARDHAWWLVHHPTRLLAAYRVVIALPRRRNLADAVSRFVSLARSLQEARVSGVHTHFAWQGVVPVLLLGALLGAPTSVTTHAKDIYLPDRDLPRWLRHITRVVTVCEYNREYLAAHGLWTGPVSVVPCGVDIPEQTPEPSAGSILTVGRLVSKKGFPVLLRAMSSVVAAVPHATLDVIGDGPQQAELEARAADLGLTGVVRFLGSRSHPETLEAIDRSPVFALACVVPPDGDTDAMPVVLREAMARARAVVTTSVAGIPETLDDTTGWVVPPDDPAALASALVEALTQRDARRDRGLAARGRVAERYTSTHTVAGMRGVFGLPPA